MLRVSASGETMIFRNEYQGKSFYSTSLSKKLADGTWENGNIGVQFRKDVEMHNKTKINVKEGFLTFYKTKDEKPKAVHYLFVLDFDVVDGQVPAGFTEIPDDETPF